MGTRFLIDTNVIIDYFNNHRPSLAQAWLTTMLAADQHALSVVTRIELLSRSASPTETLLLEDAVATSVVLSLDEPVVLETIRLRQLYKRKLPDAIIAATALTYGLTVVTRNVTDFQGIAGLLVLNPHEAATTLPPL